MKLIIERILVNRKYEHGFLGKFKLKKGEVKSAKFETGVNLLIGDIDDIEWPFIHTIARGKSNGDNPDQKIYIDKKEITLNELQKMTYYVAYAEDKFPHNIFRTTVEQHIKRALRKNKTKYSYDNIVDMFELKKTFLERRILALSHNMWLYSFAVGFAEGKKIFCLPWFTEGRLQTQTYRFAVLADVAKKEDLIILIPAKNDYAFHNGKSRLVYKIIELQ